jgi:TraK protein.
VVPVLSDLLEGQPPQGWTLHRFSDDRADYYTLRYDRVTARPVLDWTSGTGKFVKYTVSAVGKTSSTLDPSQFYQVGVRAALLSHSDVSPGHPTTLWLLWEATNGG